MSQISAKITWQRNGAHFIDNRYSRAHTWRFDGGVEVPASSSPSVVRVPMSVEAAVDPEEAFVAALASCHMLWFLHLAAGGRWCVDDYRDDAVGVMGKNPAGKIAMLRVTLRPRVRFSGATHPDTAQLKELHHGAHAACFIANSVTTQIDVEPAADA